MSQYTLTTGNVTTGAGGGGGGCGVNVSWNVASGRNDPPGAPVREPRRTPPGAPPVVAERMVSAAA